MNKTIIYASKTGHSKKIAKAIAESMNLTATDVEVKPRLEHIDLLYIVGGIYAKKSLPQLLDYIQTLDNTMVKKAVLITSSASGIAKQEEAREILIKKGIEVIEEEYTCYGKFLLFKAKHPDKEDIDRAITFARKQGGL